MYHIAQARCEHDVFLATLYIIIVIVVIVIVIGIVIIILSQTTNVLHTTVFAIRFGD